ncbi:hypothetical protein FQN49_004596 [Arthroderma sp. PD_2]|nr:hypothetical protein FQN49_004596 [Arthroderma sp. PD_2]
MAKPPVFRWQGQHNDDRSEQTSKYIDWDALLEEVQALNHSLRCAYDGRYHVGGRHTVRRIEFIDTKELWLVRIPIIPIMPTPPTSELVNTWWTAERRFTMESEIATMKYIAKSTEIPVPAVFGYKCSLDKNLVKLPYLLMECIEGNMLYDLGGPGILNDEQKNKIRKSIAAIQCQMATAAVDKLGSLILLPNGQIDIGPLPAAFGFSGPFTSEIDYFISWAEHVKFGNLKFLKSRQEDTDFIRDLRREAVEFPSRLKVEIEQFLPREQSSKRAVYPIVHPDFLQHNILYDDEYNVVGVIDWEFAHSSPPEIFAARTNMYSHFDPESLRVITESEYLETMTDVETEMGQGYGLSQAFGSTLGEIGICMNGFEEGRATKFSQVLARLKNI